MGALSPVPAVLNVLRDTYSTAASYAQGVVSTLGGASITGAPELWALQYSIGALDWQTGSGASVARGDVDWSTYRDQLTSFIQATIQVGQGAGIDMGQEVAWYVNTATPALANLTIAARAGQVGQELGTTAGAGTQGAASGVPWWVWALGAGAVLLYLSTFVPRGHATAGFGRYHSRRRRR